MSQVFSFAAWLCYSHVTVADGHYWSVYARFARGVSKTNVF